MPTPKHNNKNELYRYAGLGAQIFVSLGIAVYLGHLADQKWVKISVPIFTILLPVVVLFVMIYSLVKATSKSKKDDLKK